MFDILSHIKGEESENANNEHFDMSRSEAGGQPSATGSFRDVASNTSPIHACIKKESIEALSFLPTAQGGGLPTKPLSDTDATTSGHDVTESQVLMVETW